MQPTSQTLPWGQGQPDPNSVYQLEIDLISIPDIRVTSTFNPEQADELRESLKTEGQKDPIKVVWDGQKVILADGLNRLLQLKDLGVTTVKALVSPGNIKDVQIHNIITARHRGKENPAETAEVIKDLIENEKMDKSEVVRRLGLTDGTFRRLFAISQLPPEVKDHLKYGRLGVMAAYHIAQIGNHAEAIELAKLAVMYRYTEEQVKAAVVIALNPDVDTSTLSYKFEPTGHPVIVRPRCHGCNNELIDFAVPHSFCEGCAAAVQAFFNQYYAKAPTSTIPQTSNAQP